MRKWIDQSTFDELLLANAEDNVERAIQSASAVLETVQEFVPEAALFYRVTHAEDSLKNYFEEACTGFRRNGILFLVRQYFYPKPYYDLRFDWSFFRYADNYSYDKADLSDLHYRIIFSRFDIRLSSDFTVCVLYGKSYSICRS